MIPFVAAVAFAKKPPPVDPTTHDAAQAAACDPAVPENYQIHTGFATDPDATTAIRAAVDESRRLAIGSVCSGKSPTRCEVLTRHVEAWRQPYWNPVTGRACAHAGVRRDYLDDDQGDQERLGAELRRVAADVATAAGATPVWISPPLWTTTGCHAGPAGSAMVAELKTGLAAAGTARLATKESAAVTVWLTLDARADDVVVGASLRKPGSASLVPLVGFTVPADLFDLGAGGGDCRLDRELGLTDGQRPGADGRTVRILLPAEGSYCEGDTIEPVVVVDRPSRVEVFSVARNGEAYRVWPPAGEAGEVATSASLGSLDLVRSPDAGDEKLVAVAVAPGGGFGHAWAGFCKVPGALTAAAWPATAAAGAATFVVQPFDAPACLDRASRVAGPTAPPPAPICP
ncbi:MAG: hypothetical protein ABMA64_02495 [Myxococcota bacterium]